MGNGFRRATTWPTDWTDYNDPAYSYGRIEEGDIIGPWLFNDAYNGLNLLRWGWIPSSGTNYSLYGAWSGDGETNTKESGLQQGAVWATAKSNAETAFGASGSARSDDNDTGAQASCATFVGGYYANISRMWGYLTLNTAGSSLSGNFAKDIDYYTEPRKYSVWHSHGDGLVEDIRDKFDTQSLAAGVTVPISDNHIGDKTFSYPTWPAQPPPTVTQGYLCSGVMIVRWDVTNGLVYTT